jgi:hypothetical protein
LRSRDDYQLLPEPAQSDDAQPDEAQSLLAAIMAPAATDEASYELP